MPSSNPTTGVGVQAQIKVASQNLALSLSGVNTAQINPALFDVSAPPVEQATATSFVLSAVANASGGNSVYTGTITGGGANAFAGIVFIVAGFVTGANNGSFICTASTATTLTLANAAGVAETHAGTATSDDAVPFGFYSSNPSVATVSAAGLITGVSRGGVTVEVSYPTFGNIEGRLNNAPGGLPGSYADKIYSEINVTVNP
jgi:hypothetical protein